MKKCENSNRGRMSLRSTTAFFVVEENTTTTRYRRYLRGALLMLTLSATATYAATINVSGGGSNLQTAINNASAGDVLLVAPGTYSPINSNNKAIRIESTGGVAVTFINGNNASRCATLGSASGHTSTILIGFTLKNGYVSGNNSGGGGSYYGTLNDCTLTGNKAWDGGGAYGSTLNNCKLTGNTADSGGGGSFGSALNNCTLSENTARDGGGAYGGILTQCRLEYNTATQNGGGACGSTAYGLCTLNLCLLYNNEASDYGGGACGCTLNNCLLMGWNTAKRGGGADSSTLNHCTVVENYAHNWTPALQHSGGGVRNSTVRNSIVWGNIGKDWKGASYTDDWTGGSFTYTCTTRSPSGTGNTSSSPQFVDSSTDDYRLKFSSPCIDMGRDSVSVGNFDLDGNPRQNGAYRDMGTYEYGSYATLQNGVSVSNLSGSRYLSGNATFKYYKINVPTGMKRFVVTTTGGEGGVDVYVKQGSFPTTSSYDGRGYSSDNNETVSLNDPQSGDWYIALRPHGTYSGVTLTATYTSTAMLIVDSSPSNGGIVIGGGTHTIGSSQTLTAIPATGWRFTQWYLPPRSFFTSNPLTAEVGYADATYTAYFSLITYTVSYNGNGHTGGSTANTSHTYDTAKSLTSNGFTKTGHTFAGWATTTSGPVVYANGASVLNLTTTHNATVTLYAQWMPNTYTVAYDGNGHTDGFTENSSHTYGIPRPLTLNGFAKAGYTFAGWATTSSGSVVYADGASVSNLTATANGVYTLYAKWTANSYTVFYNSVGHTSGSMTPSSHTYGTAKNLTSCGFSWSGYTFTGWAIIPNGPAVYANGQSVLNLTAIYGGTVNLYAVWTPNTYTVSYNGNGHTGGFTASSSHIYDTSTNLTLNGFAKAGYTFAGWARTASGPAMYVDGASVQNLATAQGVTVWLYAQWMVVTNPELLDYPVWLGYYGLPDTPENKDKWLIGLDPNDPDVAFRATIKMLGDVPLIGWTPDLGNLRKYTIWGKTNLTDKAWHSPTNSATRFFKVNVALP